MSYQAAASVRAIGSRALNKIAGCSPPGGAEVLFDTEVQLDCTGADSRATTKRRGQEACQSQPCQAVDEEPPSLSPWQPAVPDTVSTWVCRLR